MPLLRTDIDKGWEFTQATKNHDGLAADKFYPVAKFPTVVQIDLLHHGLIPDPYVDQNEVKVLWVGESDWTYRTEAVPAVKLTDLSQRAVLVFDGLDTVVDVYLDKQHILSAKDMHLQYRVDVTDIISKAHGKPMTLELRFKSNVLASRAERDRLGSNGHDSDVHFGGNERLFLRKAQYHWGWDWGPAINTSGPWKDIYFEVYSTRISELKVASDVDTSLKSAKVNVSGTVESPSGSNVELEFVDPHNHKLASATAAVDSHGNFSHSFDIDSPQLWYPHQYGAQPLYTVTANIPLLHSVSKRIGIRRLELLQESLKNDPGSSFTFVINNLPVFCGGSNWIPGDLLLPNVTPERYRKWVRLAAEGNQTMIRVWGGGIIEETCFYEACDEYGVLVWQDFLFACGNYPSKDDYLELVKQETYQQVRRIRHHPSLVLLCGNNEDYLLADRWGWDWDKDDDEGPWDGTSFPARLLYEKVIPAICEEVSPEIPYWRSSPYGGRDANDPTIGDTHIWDVWHGQMAPYQKYIDFMSRFVSEFGFESPPNIRTVHRAITDPKERYSQSRTFEIHDKGPGNQRRYGMYMAENFRFRMDDLQDYIYCCQQLQAEAMEKALMHFRREFKGPNEYRCSGGLIWQLNDVWPGSSWALVDVDFHAKSAFFTVKRSLASTAIGIARNVTKTPSYIVSSYPEEKAYAEVWATTTNVTGTNVVLSVVGYDIETGKKVDLDLPDKHLVLPANKSTELVGFKIPKDTTTAIAAYIKDTKGNVVARYVSWPEPYKYLRFAEAPTVVIDATKAGTVVVHSDYPLKGVVLEVPVEEGEDAVWSNNYIDLVPGEAIEIAVENLGSKPVSARWMCHWEAKPKIQFKH